MAKTKGLKNAAKTSNLVSEKVDLTGPGILNKKKDQKMWSRFKRVSWKDEHLISSMVFEKIDIDSPEFADPAILAVRDSPKYRYSKDELIGLKEVPLSKKKPDFLNTECVPPSIWDPERWNDHKKNATPAEGASGNKGDISLQPEGRRGRPSDPRERIRKENDGIVLSPQRRSFNTGCFVPVREQPHNGRPSGPRAHSPITGSATKGDNAHINSRDIQQNSNRRIGSGRILRDTWDFNDKNENGDNEYYRNQDDRRTFRRDFDVTRDKDKQQRNNMGRFGNRRISGSEKDEEPEWFSGGPMSQNDTIELRGFEESDKGGSHKKKQQSSSSQAKRVREWAKKKNSISEDKLEEEQDNGQKPRNQVDTKEEKEKNFQECETNNGHRADHLEENQDQEQQNDNDKENRQGPPTAAGGMETINENSFIFDDIFKCDSIPGLLTNGVEGSADNNTKSKFSRWFKRESPDKASESSRRSSLHEEHILKNLLNDINEPSSTVAVNIPQLGSSDSYFAPISPAAVNAGGAVSETGNPKPAASQVNIADMFQRGKQVFGAKEAHQQNEMLNNIKTQFPGKVLSLNELESNMRKGLDISTNQNQNKNKKDDDMAAFRRLLAQVSGGQVIPANGANHQKMPAMSLMEMLSHSQQQDEAQARLNSQKSHLIGGVSSPKTPSLNPLHSEFLLKMQQAQQEQQAHLQRQQQQQANMLNKLMGLHSGTSHLRSSPLQELAQQQSKELLSRPEAQAILQAMHQRIPSPRELQVHTQSILQRALIKKRLEEQQVNFRKKQEMQQMPNSSSTNKNVSSPPTPLAFTPTSVLRKMTADKEDAGRPIVKANVGYQNTAPEQFFNVHQQQLLFNQQQCRQQQPVSGGQFNQHQKSSQQNTAGVSSLGYISQYSNQSNQQPQQFPQLTQQQLRAQHQQALPVSTNTQPAQQQQPTQQQSCQNFPQQSHQNTAWQQFLSAAAIKQSSRNNSVRKEDDSSSTTANKSSSSSTNQLSRWFSSDLLERARVGELPSTVGLAEHAISLEEIERQSAPPIHN
ncbi:eukaryotic translation initiation factor 4E transporter-like isoform X9 [Harmonia axyridis]|uniref:eukaryotic translation initiation factor 4E transporter-like isoform X9 n=1 Tax=Harmonia axyridis TaxID=115357 RepID=UPI001E27920D|nr:eukaryotic translation initiation factor 4E transporter-like isoform X9 [Harmonia axyridis]